MINIRNRFKVLNLIDKTIKNDLNTTNVFILSALNKIILRRTGLRIKEKGRQGTVGNFDHEPTRTFYSVQVQIANHPRFERNTNNDK